MVEIDFYQPIARLIRYVSSRWASYLTLVCYRLVMVSPSCREEAQREDTDHIGLPIKAHAVNFFVCY